MLILVGICSLQNMVYTVMKNFGLDVKIGGLDVPSFLAEFLERNEQQQIEIERGKLTISAMKQLNNYSRLALDAEKFRFKVLEANLTKNSDET